jgi:hypothetical protein
MAGGSSSLAVRPSGELEQGPLTLAGCGVAPLLERGGGGLHRLVDVLGPGDRRRGEHLAGGGIDEVLVPPLSGRDSLAPDEVVQYRLRGHPPSTCGIE